MIRRVVKVQLVAFVLLALGGLAYVGLNYIGVDTFTRPFHVTAQFTEAGGIFTNAEVTYRGVGVGRVGRLTLRDDGVNVELTIKKGKRIPADTLATVLNKSPVGEQYVELTPRSAGGPFLHEGSVIAAKDTRTTVPIQRVLLSLDNLSTSVNLRDLGIVIDELDKAFRDTGPSLSSLITNGDALTRTLQNSLPDTIRLINAGKTDLDTARATTGDLRRFSRALAQLSASIASSDPDLRRLLDNGIKASQQLGGLLTENRRPLALLLGNLVTINRIAVARIPGLKETLISLPAATTVLPTVVTNKQLHNGLVVDQPPASPPCIYSTPRRQPTNIAPRATPTAGYCNSVGTTQRGAKYAPRPKGDDTAGPPPSRSSSGTAAPPAAPVFTPESVAGLPGVTTYDPFTGLVAGPDGARYEMGYDGGQASVLGNRSWLALLLALLPR